MGLSEYNQDGSEVAEPDLPFFLLFKPRSDLPKTDGNSRHFEQLSGDAIPAGTTLFDVFALDENTGASPENSDELFKIGEIRSKTNFVQSLWADEKLFFNHGNLLEDIVQRPEFAEKPVLAFD